MGASQQLFVTDMKPADRARVECTLRSPHYSKPPLLETNENLDTVITADLKILAQQSIRPEQIANRLDSIIGRATTIHVFTTGDRYLIDWEGLIDTGRGFTVSRKSYRTARPGVCPYTEEDARDIACGRTNEEYTIVGKSGSLSFTGLMAHLLRDHHFARFHKLGTRDPTLTLDQVTHTLEIEPDKDYVPKTVTVVAWESYQRLQNPKATFQGRRELVQPPKNKVELAHGVNFYSARDQGLLVVTNPRFVLVEQQVSVDNIATQKRWLSVRDHEFVTDLTQFAHERIHRGGNSRDPYLFTGQFRLHRVEQTYVVG